MNPPTDPERRLISCFVWLVIGLLLSLLFTCKAASADVIFADGFEPEPTEVDYCEAVADESPQGRAHGFSGLIRTWQQAFGVEPHQTSQVAGLPAAQWQGFTLLHPTKERYLAVEFTFSDPAHRFQVQWTDVQAIGIAPGNVTVTISPCPGDFRPRKAGSSDPYLSLRCRAEFGDFGIIRASASGLGACPTPAGQPHYLNIATHDMYGSTPGPVTCPPGVVACGRAFQSQ